MLLFFILFYKTGVEENHFFFLSTSIPIRVSNPFSLRDQSYERLDPRRVIRPKYYTR